MTMSKMMDALTMSKMMMMINWPRRSPVWTALSPGENKHQRSLILSVITFHDDDADDDDDEDDDDDDVDDEDEMRRIFMIHTCRESCGVCGLLSATNKEEQEDAQSKTRSN